MDEREPWQKIESFLQNYERAYATVHWLHDWGGLTRSRPGRFIFLRFVFLAGFYVASFYLPLNFWAKISLTIIAVCLIADMLILATSFAFVVGSKHLRPLQALIYVLSNYISIALSFGLLYVTLCRSSFNIEPDFFDLVYFSFTTMTCLGLGDIIPARHTILVSFCCEKSFSLRYFLSPDFTLLLSGCSTYQFAA